MTQSTLYAGSVEAESEDDVDQVDNEKKDRPRETTTSHERAPWTLRRYLVVILVIFVLSEVIGAIVGLTQSDNDAKRAALQSTTRTAQQAAAEISDAIDHLKTSIAPKAPSASILADFANASACQLTFSADGPFPTGWTEIVRPDGSIVCSASSRGLRAPSMVGEPWLQRAASSPLLLLSSVDAGGKDSGILRAAAIPGLGLRVEYLSLRPLASLLSNQVESGSNGLEVLVTNSDNSLLLSRSIQSARSANRVISGTSFVRHITQNERVGIDGRLRIYGSARVAGSGWHVYVGTDSAKVVAGGAHLFLRQLWIILGSLALLIGALLLLDRRVTQPVKVLRGAMNRRMAGTLSGPVEVGGPAEVSSLATDFNHLISEIDQELEANARLAAIVESSDDAIFGMSLDGTITSWNHSAEQLYGYDADELLGENVIRLLAEEERLAFKGYLERVSQGEAIGHHDRRRVRKNGSQVDVAVTLFPVRDQFDRIIGASSAARDITQRIRTEAQLAVQAEDLLRSNAELEQFAYVASHDLSEPLRTISGYVELLNKRYNEKLDPDADRFIQYTVDGCNRMRQLIDDLLTFSRTGRSEKLTESVDCSNVVDMVVRDMAANRETLGASIDYEALPFVRGDRGQITQLFQNLIANSLKFSRRDVPPEVRISAVRRGRMWQIELSDNGIGIEPEYRERIFGMFQRLHPRDEYPGTGIGLAVCKRIVQAHRGEIWLGDSEIGSVFVFTLPIAEDEE